MGWTAGHGWCNCPPHLVVLFLVSMVLLTLASGSAPKPGSNPESDLSSSNDAYSNTRLVTETTKLIEEGNNQMIFPKEHKRFILILGLTGAGKTTITQLVSGDNSKMRSYEKTKGTRNFLIKDEDQRISEKNTVSKTIFPELVIDNATNEALYDCPGFADTRNASVEIANTYFIKRVVDHSEAIKIVLIVTYSSVSPAEDRSSFKSLMRNLLQFLKQPENFRNSISMVVTKVRSNQAEGEIIATVVSFLREFLEELKETSDDFPEPKAKAVVNALLQTEDDNAYPNIAFFRQPTQAGKLTELDSTQENKERIRATIFKNPLFTYQAIGSSTFGFSLSPDAQLVINGVVNKLEQRAMETLEGVETALTENFETASKQLKSINEILSDFSILQNVLVNHILNSSAKELISAYERALTDAGISPPKDLFKRVKDYLGFIEFLEEKRALAQDKNSQTVKSKISVQVFKKLVFRTEDFGSKTLQSFLDNLPQELFASYDLKLQSFSSYEQMKTSVENFTQSFTRLGPRLRGLSLKQSVDELRVVLDKVGIRNGGAVLNFTMAFDDFYETVVTKAEGDSRSRENAANSMIHAIEKLKSELTTFQSLFERLDRVIADRDSAVGWTYDPREEVEKIHMSSSHAQRKLQNDLDLLKTPPVSQIHATKSGNENFMFIQGHVISASEVTKQVSNSRNNFSFLVLGATMTVKIDEDLTLPGVTLFIFAPKLLVVGTKRISLDGLPGQNYSYPASPGQEGADGKPGGGGGTFFCSLGAVKGSGTLTITANGGRGGDGQKGGSGDYDTEELNGRDVDSSHIKMTDMKDITTPYGKDKVGCCPPHCTNCTKYLAFGEEGKPGRDGARGGRGGEGGAPGAVHTSFYKQGGNLNNIQNYTTPGRPGDGGPGGDAGQGGRYGAGREVERIHDYYYTQITQIPLKNKTEEFGEIFPVLGDLIGMWADIQFPNMDRYRNKMDQMLELGNVTVSDSLIPSDRRVPPGKAGPVGNAGPKTIAGFASQSPSYTPSDAKDHYLEVLKGYETNVFLREKILEYYMAN